MRAQHPWAAVTVTRARQQKRRDRVTAPPHISALPSWLARCLRAGRRLRAEGLRPFGGHGGDDPLEVVQGGELDHDLALVAAELHLDLGVEHVRQLVRQRVEAGGGGLLGRGTADLGALVATRRWTAGGRWRSRMVLEMCGRDRPTLCASSSWVAPKSSSSCW